MAVSTPPIPPVQVIVRVKPVAKRDAQICVTVPDGPTQGLPRKVQIHDEMLRETTQYEFDSVLPSHATQFDMHKALQPTIARACQGFDVCIFAYGQTGSGKTYSMLGPGLMSEFAGGLLSASRMKVPPGQDPYLFATSQRFFQSDAGSRGLTLRACEDIFDWAADQLPAPAVQMQAVQVYNERITDLIGTSAAEGSKSGQEWVDVKGMDDVTQLMLKAGRNRICRATEHNEHSSRSHFLVRLAISAGAKRSVLSIVDLAGSERLTYHSGSNRNHARSPPDPDTGYINRSLHTLSMCISALSDPQKPHVPWRDSQLTTLLKDSLLPGQSSGFLAVVCTLTATHDVRRQTVSTLRFASRAKKIRRDVMPLVKFKQDQPREVIRLAAENELLKNRLQEAYSRINELTLLHARESTRDTATSGGEVPSVAPLGPAIATCLDDGDINDTEEATLNVNLPAIDPGPPFSPPLVSPLPQRRSHEALLLPTQIRGRPPENGPQTAPGRERNANDKTAAADNREPSLDPRPLLRLANRPSLTETDHPTPKESPMSKNRIDFLPEVYAVPSRPIRHVPGFDFEGRPPTAPHQRQVRSATSRDERPKSAGKIMQHSPLARSGNRDEERNDFPLPRAVVPQAPRPIEPFKVDIPTLPLHNQTLRCSSSGKTPRSARLMSVLRDQTRHPFATPRRPDTARLRPNTSPTDSFPVTKIQQAAQAAVISQSRPRSSRPASSSARGRALSAAPAHPPTDRSAHVLLEHNLHPRSSSSPGYAQLMLSRGARVLDTPRDELYAPFTFRDSDGHDATRPSTGDAPRTRVKVPPLVPGRRRHVFYQ